MHTLEGIRFCNNEKHVLGLSDEDPSKTNIGRAARAQNTDDGAVPIGFGELHLYVALQSIITNELLAVLRPQMMQRQKVVVPTLLFSLE